MTKLSVTGRGALNRLRGEIKGSDQIRSPAPPRPGAKKGNMEEKPDILTQSLIAVFAIAAIGILEYLNLYYEKSSEWQFALSVVCIAGLGGFTAAVDLIKNRKQK